MEKLTYTKALAIAMDCVEDAEVKAKLSALSDSIAKKNGRKSTAPTKTQRENEVFKAQILDAMEVGKQYSVTELYKMFEDTISSPQKMSALVRQLKDANLVERIEEKGKARFSKIEG